ncbi:hypothetical protein M2459_001364 [Parabacteroides sp. PF5-5]|uniref:hypothetical protein n=1 Tax=unclassified Parabacteroides TaxID=2649774 RepID=UPI002476F37E|nr:MULTISPECIES: hypothetical protein [unclassified Parabacteroides]MDH6304629.1 hypothetical protein [Parabacteroides sp. PH5-39]MDH6315758.1 hypothetical protein [Parabacteroides sp. PF5-13]MDH6319417.1 hypothetical protein [Parabacteroides sp. PH5-13]MDH6323148.1 hypothetical protein [Parabacteroides sp. PH5-8]MDH6326950.1 hypothetical protein [Parabacteroides sp. PH5-41]
MKNENITNRYEEMLSTIEDAKIYDGRGVYDLYECEKCGHQQITLYEDKGVTPFMIRCECGDFMQHTKSFRSVPDYIRVSKWRRPTLDQLLMLSDVSIEHVLNGGLVLDSEIHLAMLSKKQQPSMNIGIVGVGEDVGIEELLLARNKQSQVIAIQNKPKKSLAWHQVPLWMRDAGLSNVQNIITEYNLIQEKKSKLSTNKRRLLVEFVVKEKLIEINEK